MNRVVLMGRVVRDPEVRYTSGQDAQAVARFTLAVDRRVARNNGENTADFIQCTAWGKRAEFMEKYGRKGTKFVLEGRIQTGSYTKSDGTKAYTTEVVVENIEFAESKNTSAQPTQQTAPADDTGFMQVADTGTEELPFA